MSSIVSVETIKYHHLEKLFLKEMQVYDRLPRSVEQLTEQNGPNSDWFDDEAPAVAEPAQSSSSRSKLRVALGQKPKRPRKSASRTSEPDVDVQAVGASASASTGVSRAREILTRQYNQGFRAAAVAVAAAPVSTGSGSKWSFTPPTVDRQLLKEAREFGAALSRSIATKLSPLRDVSELDALVSDCK